MPKRQTTEEIKNCEEARKNKENLTKSIAINRESDGQLMSSRNWLLKLEVVQLEVKVSFTWTLKGAEKIKNSFSNDNESPFKLQLITT